MRHENLGPAVALLGAMIVVVTSADLGGCDNTVERADSSGATTSSGTSMSAASSSADMCSGAASIDGDGAGCPCGSDPCGFCMACGPCDTSADCPTGDKCIHADGLCGGGAKGECMLTQGGDCGFSPNRVCTCDGNVESEDCAMLLGHDVSKDATICSNGTFSCGGVMCKNYVEYCQMVSGGPPDGGGPFYSCLSASPSCSTGIADCSCVSSGNTCSTDANGQVTVEILAP